MVRDEYGGAFEDHRLGFAREMDRDGGIGHQVAHPARFWRATEAQCAVNPHPIDGPNVRPRVWANRRYPVIRRGPKTLFDVAPGKKAVGTSRHAISGRKADRNSGGRFSRHHAVAESAATA